jgi:spermidine/putrescine transport system ATP-binding protein
MSKVILSLKNIRKDFNKVVAVRNVNLEIEEGEFFSLLGPSGCGKTTTLRLIGGFEKPTSGEILLNGKIINNMPPNKRDINTVFQNYALFPHMSVYKNLTFGLENKGFSKKVINEKIDAILKIIKLEQFGGRRPSELSGGQQQRVALARALVNNPSILLLDEPLGALDLKIRKHMQIELKKIQKSVGITFIYVTHDQEEALTLSDRIAIMNEGELIQVGSPEKIYLNPKSKFVADFIGEANIIEGKITGKEKGMLKINIGSDKNVLVPTTDESIFNNDVCVVIRPEDIKILAQDNIDNYNVVGGKIRDIIFKGVGVLYNVELTNGTIIRLLDSNKEHELGHFNNNNEVKIGWEYSRGVLINEKK